MSSSTDFHDLVVDFPKPHEMAIFWAQTLQLDFSASRFGWDATSWDIIDLRLTMGGGVMALMRSIAEAVIGGMNIVIFLGGVYDLTRHIRSIRSSEAEITTMATHWRNIQDPYARPKVDILLIRDTATMEALAQKSAYLGLLMDVITGQPQDEAAAYFLSDRDAIIDGGYGYDAL